jgi:hypothetical protein
MAQIKEKVNAEFTISKNEQFGSYEIKFDGIPAKETRDALKALRFRWHSVKKVWYGFADDETLVWKIINGIEEDCYVADPVKAEEPKAKASYTAFDKDALRAEYAKVWGKDQKMIDYCMNNTAAVIELSRGELVTISKQKIKTRFCFGEGSNGVTLEEAAAQAQNARTSFEHFKRENLATFKSYIDAIEKAKELDGYALAIENTRYRTQYEDCRLARIDFYRLSKVLDDCGGSAYLEELPGKEIAEKGSGRKYRIASKEEIEKILNAYKEAAAAHEKKIGAYLKRYGTSKVEAWTYWVDA